MAVRAMWKSQVGKVYDTLIDVRPVQFSLQWAMLQVPYLSAALLTWKCKEKDPSVDLKAVKLHAEDMW